MPTIPVSHIPREWSPATAEAIDENFEFLRRLRSQDAAAVGAATALSPTFIVQVPHILAPNAQALSLLATGLLKSTTTTGVVSIAVSGTDYLTPTGNGSGLTHITAANIDAGTASIDITGNAGSATKLQTARAIAGINFDGTAAVTIAAGQLTNGITGSGTVVLRTNASMDNPTFTTPTLGTPTSGVATNLTQIPAANLRIASQATGDTLYASSATVWARLGIGSAGQVLVVSGGLPAWVTPGGGIGTVTSVTSADANATVATSTTTPVITIVSAPKWATARNLAGNSVDGSASVAFANKFVVQGTTDAGLSAAQFLGALGTGIVKNTTTTGVLSIAVAGDFPTLNQNTTGSAATLTTARTIGGVSFDGSANITVATATGGFTVSGGDLALGANNLTLTGSIGATGARVLKGWFTDLQVTNAVAGSITGNAATVTTNANLTGPITSVGNATSIASQTGTGTTFVMNTSPTLVTPALGTPTSGVATNLTQIPAAQLLIASQAAGDVLYASSTTVWTRLGVGANGTVLTLAAGVPTWSAAGAGSVTSVSVVTANGVSGSVATATTTPAITLTLGAITPTTVNGLTISTSTGTLTITNAKTVSVANTLTFTGTDASSVAFGTGGTVAYTANNLSVFAATTSAQLAGVISDETGSGALMFGTTPTMATPVINGLATGTGVASAATASTLVARDSSANISVNNTLHGYTTSSGASAVLTAASTYFQYTTYLGSPTVSLPVTSTLVLGQQFYLVNNALGSMTVSASGGPAVGVIPTGGALLVTCILTSGTGAASWDSTPIYRGYTGQNAVNFDTGGNNILTTGSIGSSGARLLKGWFTDLDVSNTITGSVSGNAATATTLQTARTIGGVSFNGSAAITVATATGGFTVSGGGSFGFAVSATRSLHTANGEPYSVAAQYNGSGGEVYFGASNSATPDAIISNNAGTAILTVKNSGVIQFNAGYGVGTITSDASGNLTAVSDPRYKDRIAALPYGLVEVLQLDPVQHGFTEHSGLDTQNLYGGFLASSVPGFRGVQPVMPLAVGINSAGYLTLADRPILGAVVNAIKTLDARLTHCEQSE